MTSLPTNHDLASRLEQAQATALAAEVPEILTKEVTNCQQAYDKRVSVTLAEAIREHYLIAQQRFLEWRHHRPATERSRMLMAPTSRVVDYSVSAEAIQVLIRALEAEGHAAALREAINTGGPSPGGIWLRAETPVHVVASILRWSALHGNIKGRITSSGEAREWIFEVLLKHYGSEEALRPRLGGVSAANSVQGVALGDDVSMMALGTLPKEVAARLPRSLHIVGDNPAWRTVDDIPKEDHFAGHFAILSNPNHDTILPPSWDSIVVNGQQYSQKEVRWCDILITGSASTRDFGSLPGERLASLGASHDVVILTGAQYLLNDESTTKYFSAVETLHTAGACIALSYVEAKDRHFEFKILAAIQRSTVIDAYSANTGETFQLIRRLVTDSTAANELRLGTAQQRVAARLAAQGDTPCSRWGTGHENPSWLAEAALFLQEVLNIPLVRIRGKAFDITVVARGISINQPDDVAYDLIMSRVAAVIKVAIPQGLITSLTDIQPLRNIPFAPALAGLFEVRDMLTSRGLTSASEAVIPHALYVTLSDGRTIFTIPPIDMYVRDGGTTSAGDLMDYVFLSQQAKKLCPQLRRQ